MAKARKNTSASSVQTPVVESVSQPVVQQVSVPTPVVQQVVEAPSQVETVVETPTQVSAVVETPTQVATVVDSVPVVSTSNEQPSSQTSYQARYESLFSRVRQCQSLLREISTELVALNKEVLRTSRPLLKKSVKKSNSNAKSGITQEVNVSKDLEGFLGVSEGTKISRTEVTRAITSYIKEHDLQDPKNRRVILPDETLSKILNAGSEQVTYFNLQKFLKVHYAAKA